MLHSLIEALQANVVLVGLLVGSVTPLLTSLVQQPKWSKNVRIAVAVVVSVVVGFAIAAADGKLNPGNFFAVVMAVLVSAEAFYQKLWKPTGVAPSVERATTLSARKTGDDEFEAYLDDPYGYDDRAEVKAKPKGLEYK